MSTSNKVSYTKDYLTYDEQIILLKSRGMIISDEQYAKELLSRIGYYHLSGYWYPFRQKHLDQNGDCIVEEILSPNIRFEDVAALMDFDRKLRNLLFNLIEGIELALRCKIAYTLGYEDKFAHTNKSKIDPEFLKWKDDRYCSSEYDKWRTDLDKKISITTNKNKEAFAVHFAEKYARPFPIWICCEFWDFGAMSKFYQMIHVKYRRLIAESLNVPNQNWLVSWLRSINYVRNLCAHSGRLWNKRLTIKPQLHDNGTIPDLQFLLDEQYDNATPATIISIMAYLHKVIAPSLNERVELFEHISKNMPMMPQVSPSVMGFCSGWENEAIWK